MNAAMSSTNVVLREAQSADPAGPPRRRRRGAERDQGGRRRPAQQVCRPPAPAAAPAGQARSARSTNRIRHRRAHSPTFKAATGVGLAVWEPYPADDGLARAGRPGRSATRVIVSLSRRPCTAVVPPSCVGRGRLLQACRGRSRGDGVTRPGRHRAGVSRRRLGTFESGAAAGDVALEDRPED